MDSGPASALFRAHAEQGCTLKLASSPSRHGLPSPGVWVANPGRTGPPRCPDDLALRAVSTRVQPTSLGWDLPPLITRALVGARKRIVAKRGRATMFTALWLTDAHPELFPVMIWLAFGLLGAKWRSAAPSAAEAQAAITN
jgi:hypothetical protein